jgi:3-oxoisoapionate kinase
LLEPVYGNGKEQRTMNQELLLAYYGDDFTGSTDVMEALSQAGLRTVLFLKPPTAKQLAKFPGLRAFGIAGGSRTMSPEEMERELPPAFEALKSSGAPIVHYKMCSTFDSTPTIGSIGKAIEIGRTVFGERPTPLVVGAPVLGRYVVFGNLFARSGLDTEPFRLDRHPTMSRHPVTPMNEADIRLILAEQTKLPVELVDVLQLDGVPRSSFLVPGGSPAPIVLFDTLRNEHLPVIGKAIEEMAKGGQLFAVGSSGVEYALTAHWHTKLSAESGREHRTNNESTFVSSDTLCFTPAAPKPAAQIIAVSGSCSPVTERQLTMRRNGVIRIPLDSRYFLGVEDVAVEVRRLLDTINNPPHVNFASNPSFIFTTGAPRGGESFVDNLTGEQSAKLSIVLAKFLEGQLQFSGVKRAVVCGGDTSMHVARALGIEALEYVGPMAPGSPLCKVHAPGRIADGCEIVFKGGQVGRDRFFLDVLNGGPAAE